MSNTSSRNHNYDTIISPIDLLFAILDKRQIDDSLEKIITQAIQNISLDTSHLLLEKELEAVYYRDQIFRDSIQLYSKNADEKNKFMKQMIQSDLVNQKIILTLFKKAGWPDTRDMNKKASEGIWMTIIHCNNNKEFNREALKYLNVAFREDSIISNQVYAITGDRINIRLEGKSIYGTSAYFGMKKEYDSSTIDEFNKQRKLIGLSNYLEEDGYY